MTLQYAVSPIVLRQHNVRIYEKWIHRMVNFQGYVVKDNLGNYGYVMFSDVVWC